jgi:prophage regulatory protein
MMTRPEVVGRKVGANKSSHSNRNRPAYSGPRFLRLPAVLEFAGFGRTKLYEEIELGRFPRPVRLVEGGRAIGWDETELVEWRNSRLAARDAGSAPSRAEEI